MTDLHFKDIDTLSRIFKSTHDATAPQSRKTYRALKTDLSLREDFTRQIRKHASTILDTAGRKVNVIKDDSAKVLAKRFACSLAAIYALAMNIGVWPYRYVRNQDALTLADQFRLAGARVAVIGAGGLGGQLLLLLARIGIGHITIVDPDVFDESNLNRQALANVANLGQSKAEEAARAAKAINPAVEIRPIARTLNRSTAPSILKEMDLAVDALDSIHDRLILQKAAQRLGVPMVHGAIAGFVGQVMTILPGDPGLRDLYGEKIPRKKSNPKSAESIIGVPAPTPCMVASLQTAEVVKLLLNRGRIIRNRLLCVDLEYGDFNEVSFESGTP